MTENVKIEDFKSPGELAGGSWEDGGKGDQRRPDLRHTLEVKS